MPEWTARFDEVDLWWAPVQTPAAVVQDAQAHAAGLFVDIPMADAASSVRSVASPVRFSDADTRPRTPLPRLGEHGTEVLRELGVGDDEISRLRAANVLGG